MKTKSVLIGLFLATVFTLSFAQQLLAAPFCAVFSYGAQCRYYTYDQCKNAVGANGYCAVNTADTRQTVSSPFCVVLPYGNVKRCTYQDAKVCNEAATAAGGVCLSTRREVVATGQEKDPAAVGEEGSTGQGTVGGMPANMGAPAAHPPIPGISIPLLNSVR